MKLVCITYFPTFWAFLTSDQTLSSTEKFLVESASNWWSKVDPTAAEASGGGTGKGNNNGTSSRTNSKDKASSSQGSEKSLSLKKRTKVQPIDGEWFKKNKTYLQQK